MSAKLSETLFTITWRDEVSVEDRVRLSRSWAAAISAKPVVADVRVQLPAPKPPPRTQRARLRPTRLHSNLGVGAKKNFAYYTIGTATREQWCMGCGVTVRIGERRARNDNGAWLCTECIDLAETEEATPR